MCGYPRLWGGVLCSDFCYNSITLDAVLRVDCRGQRRCGEHDHPIVNAPGGRGGDQDHGVGGEEGKVLGFQTPVKSKTDGVGGI